MKLRSLIPVLALAFCSNAFAISLGDLKGDYVLAEAQGFCSQNVNVSFGMEQNHPQMKLQFTGEAGNTSLEIFSRINGGTLYDYNENAHAAFAYSAGVTFDGIELVARYHNSMTTITGRVNTLNRTFRVLKDQNGDLIYDRRIEKNGATSHDRCRYSVAQ